MKALFVLLASCALFFGSARPAAAQFVFSFGGGPCYPSYGGYYSDYYGYYPGYYPSYYGYGWGGYFRPWGRLRGGCLLSALVAASVLRRVLWRVARARLGRQRWVAWRRRTRLAWRRTGL